jgi:hypothetical protein
MQECKKTTFQIVRVVQNVARTCMFNLQPFVSMENYLEISIALIAAEGTQIEMLETFVSMKMS